MTTDDLLILRQKAQIWPDEYPPCVDDLPAYIDALTAERDAERELADELAAALERDEWCVPDADYPDEVYRCGQCGGSEYIGHSDDCPAGAALARYRAARQEFGRGA